MRGWFGPQPGSNAGYGGIWVSYAVTPVTWEGWLATAIYFALQVGVLFGLAKIFEYLQQPLIWAALPLIPLHLAYQYFASRHYMTRAEMDPWVLPSDLRPPEETPPHDLRN